MGKLGCAWVGAWVVHGWCMRGAWVVHVWCMGSAWVVHGCMVVGGFLDDMFYYLGLVGGGEGEDW